MEIILLKLIFLHMWKFRSHRLKDDKLVNVNGHPDIEFDSIEEKDPNYIEEKGKIIKQ